MSVDRELDQTPIRVPQPDYLTKIVFVASPLTLGPDVRDGCTGLEQGDLPSFPSVPTRRVQIPERPSPDAHLKYLRVGGAPMFYVPGVGLDRVCHANVTTTRRGDELDVHALGCMIMQSYAFPYGVALGW